MHLPGSIAPDGAVVTEDDFAAALADALQSSGADVYAYHREPVTLVNGHIAPVEPSTAGGVVTANVGCLRSKVKDGEVEHLVAPAGRHAWPGLRHAAAAGYLPSLTGVTSVPLLVPNSSGRPSWTAPGYNPASGIYQVGPAITSFGDPGDLEALHQEVRIVQLLAIGADLSLGPESWNPGACDFPLKTYADVMAFTAYRLTVLTRNIVRGPVPLIGTTKANPRTGCTQLLRDAGGIYARGSPWMDAALPKDISDQQCAWAIASAIRTGPDAGVTVFDNVENLAYPSLAKLATATTFSVRDASKATAAAFDTSSLIFAFTIQNQAVIPIEIAQRMLIFRLYWPGPGKPEDRAEFRLKGPWPQGALDIAARVQAADRAMIDAWIEAGCPSGAVSLASFQHWSAVVSGIMHCVGLPTSFLEPRKDWIATQGGSPRERDTAALLNYMRNEESPLPGGDLWAPAELVEVCAECGWFPFIHEKTATAAAIALGRILKPLAESGQLVSLPDGNVVRIRAESPGKRRTLYAVEALSPVSPHFHP